MEFMYLAHVNFSPVDNSMLIDTVPDDPAHLRIRTEVPEFFQPTASHRDFVEALQNAPALHRALKPGRPIDPELVMGMTFRTDAEGWAHSMQMLPDGTADFISHRPDELGHGVRWITRTSDQDALGLFLPGTAEADGYSAEKAKGNVQILQPNTSFHCEIEFGVLDEAEASAMAQTCREVLDKELTASA